MTTFINSAPFLKLIRQVDREYLNDQGNLFGGNALKWMDEVAYLAAGNFTGQRMVTVSVDKVRFRAPIHQGTTIELTGRILSSGNVKLTVAVEVRETGSIAEPHVDGIFTFVAVDDSGKPIRLSPAE